MNTRRPLPTHADSVAKPSAVTRIVHAFYCEEHAE